MQDLETATKSRYSRSLPSASLKVLVMEILKQLEGARFGVYRDSFAYAAVSGNLES